MANFDRKIDLKHLAELDGDAFPWLKDLFKFWAPAGTGPRPGTGQALRLAIRNGYLNFYANGQSAARVSMGPRSLKASVHEKYCEPDTNKRASLGQKYISFGPGSMHDLQQDAVAGWVAVATGSATIKGYAGAEKSFVERLVSANPDVIDLEMTLPALAGTRSAVRVDLVALEPNGDGWKLVFWEAKMVKNPEARAKGDATPKVVGQQRQYHNWLDAAGRDNKADVLRAYRQVCRDMVQIHTAVAKSNVGADLPPLGKGIVAVAEGARLTLDEKVRLIIDNAEEDASFERNGHLAKLRDNEIFVQVVDINGDHSLQGPAA